MIDVASISILMNDSVLELEPLNPVVDAPMVTVAEDIVIPAGTVFKIKNVKVRR